MEFKVQVKFSLWIYLPPWEIPLKKRFSKGGLSIEEDKEKEETWNDENLKVISTPKPRGREKRVKNWNSGGPRMGPFRKQQRNTTIKRNAAGSQQYWNATALWIYHCSLEDFSASASIRYLCSLMTGCERLISWYAAYFIYSHLTRFNTPITLL